TEDAAPTPEQPQHDDTLHPQQQDTYATVRVFDQEIKQRDSTIATYTDDIPSPSTVFSSEKSEGMETESLSDYASMLALSS
ncbi:hypothetical protein SARC_18271, partial [Sphaeroforma arctica JP610]